MDKQRVRECEEDYLRAAQRLDELEKEVADEIVRQRAIGNVYAARDAAISEIGPYFNQLKAQLYIAKLRLENAWREQGD